MDSMLSWIRNKEKDRSEINSDSIRFNYIEEFKCMWICLCFYDRFIYLVIYVIRVGSVYNDCS